MIWHNGIGYVILLLLSVYTANNLQIPRVKKAKRAVLPEGGRETGRSDRVLIKYDGTDDEARLFGESLGWTWKRKVLSRYEFTVSTRGPEYELTELRKSDKNVKSVEYEDFLVRVKRVVTINDAEWNNQWNLYTTGPSNTCVDDFSGTSAACPAASGILALTLEANSALTWRDIQHMIVEHSTTASLHSDAGFYTNGAGKMVSHKLGFGLMDAEAMVDNAPSWQTVPSRTSCYTGLSSVQKYSYANAISDSIAATDCFISYLEHVIVEISYKAFWRGDVQFNLLSPSGTNTTIFRARTSDSSSSKTTVEFTSVHNWGEDPDGVWTLTMSDTWGTTTMNLYYWSLTFYGTVTDPLAGQPTAGTLGGSCTTTTDCSGVTDGGCLEDALVCVSCTGNYRIVGDFCKQDGRLGGYCSASLTCWQDTLECVNNVCKTVSEEESETNIALIAGIVVGCLVGVSLLASLGFFIYKKFHVPKSRVAPSYSGHYPNTGNTSSVPGAYPSGPASNVFHPYSSQPTPANDSLYNTPSAPPPPLSTNTGYPVQQYQPYTISGSENPAFQQ